MADIDSLKSLEKSIHNIKKTFKPYTRHKNVYDPNIANICYNIVKKSDKLINEIKYTKYLYTRSIMFRPTLSNYYNYMFEKHLEKLRYNVRSYCTDIVLSTSFIDEFDEYVEMLIDKLNEWIGDININISIPIVQLKLKKLDDNSIIDLLYMLHDNVYYYLQDFVQEAEMNNTLTQEESDSYRYKIYGLSELINMTIKKTLLIHQNAYTQNDYEKTVRIIGKQWSRSKHRGGHDLAWLTYNAMNFDMVQSIFNAVSFSLNDIVVDKIFDLVELEKPYRFRSFTFVKHRGKVYLFLRTRQGGGNNTHNHKEPKCIACQNDRYTKHKRYLTHADTLDDITYRVFVFDITDIYPVISRYMKYSYF